ncbi:hypothetical protein [Marinomonas aquiplantarum]|uniref:Uncharacterized protein n=1 Tax=Marinomonas aquiplantarum TaxID=491951 RepID=A0A366CYK1_9GAMM|nr:hypothetical protein [Marinomonas aquiplantarum]RBO82746.1 hypothetical protein DFP76_105219 [Marinomonas aquiplantarum]
MKNLTKAALTLLTATAMTSAFAASDDNYSDRIQSTKAGIEALSNTLENMGATVDASVDLNGAYTPSQKEAVYAEKYSDLQDQFDALHAQSAE